MSSSERLPRQLGEFQVVRAIARGGMGAVFEVRSARSGTTYAAKTILRPGDPAARERFKREAELLARCDRHPGVVKIHSIGEDSQAGTLFMILDLVPGENLESVLERDRKLEPRRVAQLGREVALALAFVHETGVIHRDVKPSNILLDASGCARLTDFGIATATDVERLTRTGMFLGTVHWVSPEQATGGEVGPASDVFALGLILYRALAGNHPFEDLEGTEYLAKLANPVPIPDVRTFAPEVPKPLASIVGRAIEKEPADRYESAHEMAEDLAAFLEGRPIRRARRRLPRLPLVVLPVLAVALLAVVVATAFNRPGEPAATQPSKEDGLDERAMLERAEKATPAEALALLGTSRSAEARLARARALVALGRVPEARAELEGLPSSAGALELQGDVAMATSDWRKAEEAYSSGVAKNPALRFKRAEAASLAGDAKGAASDIRALLGDPQTATDPRLAPALYQRALATEDEAERRNDIEAALRMAPPRPALRHAVAQAYSDLASEGMRRWSERILGRFELTDKQFLELHDDYARLKRASGLEAGLEAHGLGQALFLFSLFKRQDREKTSRVALKFLEDWPDDPLWLYLLAYTEQDGTDEQKRDARDRIERAIDGCGPPSPDTDPALRDFAAGVAVCAFDLAKDDPAGRLDVGRARIQKIVDCADDADIYLRLTEYCRERGDFDGGHVALEKARAGKTLEGHPVNPEALIERESGLLMAEGHFEEALAAVTKIKDRKPRGLRLYVAALHAAGHDEEVARLVSVTSTDDVQTLVTLAVALIARGQFDDAKPVVQKLETLKTPRFRLAELEAALEGH
jgi:hypothetical protein